MCETRLEDAWRELRRARRTALIPYLTAGHPDRRSSIEALRRAAEHADLLEVGVAFSDPLADGPTIQRSSFEALRGGMTLARTLELIAEAGLKKPVVLFSYLNPVRRYGVDRLVRDAADLGLAGLLLTDLPAGSDPEVEETVRHSPLALIRLVAPTTTGARLQEVVTGAQGFLYLVARLGVTGASAALASGIGDYLARVRAASPLPLAVGFGISTPEQAARVAGMADGVVVGSALVERLARDGPEAAGKFLGQLRAAIDQADREREA